MSKNRLTPIRQSVLACLPSLRQYWRRLTRRPVAPPDAVTSSHALHRRLCLARLALPPVLGLLLAAFKLLVVWQTGQSLTAGYVWVELAMLALVIPAALWGIITLIDRSWRSREQAEAIIRGHEQYLASITSASADAIISLDLNGRLKSWNHGAELIFGYRADEVLGHSFGEILHTPDKANGLWERIEQRFVERGFVRNYETEATAKNGRRIWIDLTQTVLYDANREVVGSSLVVRDITEARRSQEEVRRLNIELEQKVADRTRSLQAAYDELEQKNSELKQLDRLKSDFVSLVSHELRAPLTNVNGGLELLTAAADIPADHRRTLGIIRRQSERLTQLVESILKITRLDANKMPLNLGPLDIGPALRSIAREMAARAPHHHFVWPEPTGLPLLWADEDRLTDILFNLLDNAVKYSPPGSDIRLTVSPQADCALFTVSDSGQGIDTGALPHIFEKFYQAEAHDARQVYGHGLGLYLTRKLVEAQGGQIFVDSRPGHGTQFTFSLPLAPEDV